MNIGIRYAKALFQLAERQQKIDQLMQELIDVKQLFIENEWIRNVFYDQLMDTAKKIKVLADVYDKLSLSKEVKNLLILLIDGGREQNLEDIVAAYEQMYYDYKGLIKAEVYSAYDMTTGEVEALKGRIKALFNKEPILTINKDSSVIGGMKLRVGWTVYDGTIRTNLLGFTDSIKI